MANITTTAPTNPTTAGETATAEPTGTQAPFVAEEPPPAPPTKEMISETRVPTTRQESQKPLPTMPLDTKPYQGPEDPNKPGWTISTDYFPYGAGEKGEPLTSEEVKATPEGVEKLHKLENIIAGTSTEPKLQNNIASEINASGPEEPQTVKETEPFLKEFTVRFYDSGQKLRVEAPTEQPNISKGNKDAVSYFDQEGASMKTEQKPVGLEFILAALDKYPKGTLLEVNPNGSPLKDRLLLQVQDPLVNLKNPALSEFERNSLTNEQESSLYVKRVDLGTGTEDVVFLKDLTKTTLNAVNQEERNIDTNTIKVTLKEAVPD